MTVKSFSRSLTLVTIALSSCATDIDIGEETAPEPGAISQAIEVGTNDTSSPTRNAVALLSVGCTATLVAPDLLLTAAHCGFENREYYDARWHTLPTPVTVKFGPQRSAPVYTTSATQVSLPPYAPTPWPEDIALLRLATSVPSTIAIPRPIYVDRPAALNERSTIYQVGYGGGRNRRVMTGSQYTDWLTETDWPTNGFAYTATHNGPGIGDRDTNIEGGDSGGPMLLGGDTGFVIGDLSHWGPYGIATFGPGTGTGCTERECTAPNRPSIRGWISANVPQRSDLRLRSLGPIECRHGAPHVRVRVENVGSKTASAVVDFFAARSGRPSVGTTSSVWQSVTLAPTATKDFLFSAEGAAGEQWFDAIVDTRQIVQEQSEANNTASTRIRVPSCPRVAERLRFTFINGADGARGGHTILAGLRLADGTVLTSQRASGGAEWPASSRQTIEWTLPREIKLTDIEAVQVHFEDGDCFACTGDDWHIANLKVEITAPSNANQVVVDDQSFSFHMRGVKDIPISVE